MLTEQALSDIDWILSDLKGYRFDDKTKEAIQNACYIVRQLNATLGGGVGTGFAYDVLNQNYILEALDNGTLIKPE